MDGESLFTNIGIVRSHSIQDIIVMVFTELD